LIEAGSRTKTLFSMPPRTGPTRNGSVNPGIDSLPPLLEKAAASSFSGQPLKVTPPVKYCLPRFLRRPPVRRRDTTRAGLQAARPRNQCERKNEFQEAWRRWQFHADLISA